jgi:guanine deaminase
MSDIDYLRAAIALSRQAVETGSGGPFGAVVVQDGVIVGRGTNRVVPSGDPTAHAEIVAIRRACARLGRFELSGATLYSSCEPCPMCLAAAYWARLEAVWYAASTADAGAVGFDDERLYRELAQSIDRRQLTMRQMLRDEAREVLAAWRARPDRVAY